MKRAPRRKDILEASCQKKSLSSLPTNPARHCRYRTHAFRVDEIRHVHVEHCGYCVPTRWTRRSGNILKGSRLNIAWVFASFCVLNVPYSGPLFVQRKLRVLHIPTYPVNLNGSRDYLFWMYIVLSRPIARKGTGDGRPLWKTLHGRGAAPHSGGTGTPPRDGRHDKQLKLLNI